MKVKMDAKIREQWIKDLRSGKFLQTTGILRRETPEEKEKMCCLGVLTNQCPDIKWKNNLNRQDIKYYGCIPIFNDSVQLSSYNLSLEIVQWANIEWPENVFDYDNDHFDFSFDVDELPEHLKERVKKVGYKCLAGLNDGRFTFEEIAQVIECVTEGI